MSRYVIDASIAIKWFVPETHSDVAAQLLNGVNDDFLAPDLLFAEFGNILWKKVQQGHLNVGEIHQIIEAFRAVPIAVHSTNTLLEPALEIACGLRRSLYDSLYLALAVMHECSVVTADRRLYNALQGSVLEPHVTWVEAVSV